jgi:hypothetical protein
MASFGPPVSPTDGAFILQDLVDEAKLFGAELGHTRDGVGTLSFIALSSDVLQLLVANTSMRKFLMYCTIVN